MTVRPARPDDVGAIAAVAADIYRRVFRPLLGNADLSAFDAAHFARRFADSLPRIRVAEHAGRPGGFCLLTDGTIDILFVERGSRNAGLGAVLLRDAEAFGARRLECFAANEAARRFYEREGWRIDAEYRRDFAGASHSFVRFVRNPVS